MENVKNSEIVISVKLQTKDLLKFKCNKYYGSLRGKMSILWLILFYVIILIFLQVSMVAFLLYLRIAILMTIIIILGPFIVIALDSAMYMKRDHFINKEQSYRFSDIGVNVSSDCSNLNIKWDELYRVVFSRYNIAIFISKDRAIIIPKRIFDGNNKLLEDLKQIFKSNVDKKKLKIR